MFSKSRKLFVLFMSFKRITLHSTVLENILAHRANSWSGLLYYFTINILLAEILRNMHFHLTMHNCHQHYKTNK